MHFMEIVALKKGKHNCCAYPWPSLALSPTQPGWLFTWQLKKICLCKISRTSSIIWNSIQIDHCQKPSSQQYPWMQPSSNWKSPTSQSPCHSRPPHHTCPTRTSHASYVGHQHNIPYNLKGKPSSTCIQSQHDSSNFLCRQLLCHQQSQTNSFAICHQPRKPPTHTAWIPPPQQSFNPLWVTLVIHIWANWPSLLNGQQLPINGNVLILWVLITDFCWAHQHSPIAAIFSMLQFRTRMLYLSHDDIMMHSHINTWHHSKISKAHRANKMTRDSKIASQTHFHTTY